MKNVGIIIALFIVFSFVGMIDSYQVRGKVKKNKDEIELIKRSNRVQDRVEAQKEEQKNMTAKEVVNDLQKRIAEKEEVIEELKKDVKKLNKMAAVIAKKFKIDMDKLGENE